MYVVDKKQFIYLKAALGGLKRRYFWGGHRLAPPAQLIPWWERIRSFPAGSLLSFGCLTGGNLPQWRMMTKPIQWPDGDFTIQAAVDLNAGVPQAEVRKKLAADIAAKTLIQTQKGNGKIKGQFRVVK